MKVMESFTTRPRPEQSLRRRVGFEETVVQADEERGHGKCPDERTHVEERRGTQHRLTLKGQRVLRVHRVSPDRAVKFRASDSGTRCGRAARGFAAFLAKPVEPAFLAEEIEKFFSLPGGTTIA
jgi:hypothetical protein